MRTACFFPVRLVGQPFLFALLVPLLFPACRSSAGEAPDVNVRGIALNQPIAVYNNWSAYDELSDRVELTESLAIKQFDELLRLRRAGVRLDHYLMDAFWYSRTGGYREFRRPHWPNGPDRWLAACRQHRVKPGLWLASNQLSALEPAPEWESSLNESRTAMCLFEGGFLAHFLETLQFWVDRGVRLFKFDFADLGAATPALVRQLKREDIVRRNSDALREALVEFRRRNPEVLFAAFNGFGGEMDGTFAPVRQTVDPRWLLAFDSLYCGDPRPADVPAMNFWRSKDVYSDHMTRYYERNGIPLERIDNTGFMVGTTGTCYGRRTAAWKGMLLLEHARGGWMNVYYGNLELLDDRDASWFAKVQALYFNLLSFGRTFSFGAMPGEGEPYGFSSVDAQGALYTVLNPSQSIRAVPLPRVHLRQTPLRRGRVLFRDEGFAPRLTGDTITLGPEQLAVVGFGEYRRSRYDLGVQRDVVIPLAIRPLAAAFAEAGRNAVAATVTLPPGSDLRIVMQQFANGQPCRTSRGAPPDGTSLGRVLQLRVTQAGRTVPVHINYDKAIWSGLSWAVGEVRSADLKPGEPVTVHCASLEEKTVELKAELRVVDYRKQ